jgi:potassium-transporting ATPase potassium-binding subunit
MGFGWTIVALIAVLAIAWRFLGSYMAAVFEGRVRWLSRTIGNFWVDLVRATIYILMPIAFVAAIIFMAQGAVQTLAGPAHIHDALNGVRQVIPLGPVASREVIKQLGTNGGGFFNANGAHPFENPTGLTNFLSIALILCIPVALTYTFGNMAGSIRQGAAILAVMAILFGSWNPRLSCRLASSASTWCTTRRHSARTWS